MMTDEIAILPSDCKALVLVGKQKKTKWCRYCEKWIGVQGFDAHVHFRHLAQYMDEFRWTMLRNHADLFWEVNGGAEAAFILQKTPLEMIMEKEY